MTETNDTSEVRIVTIPDEAATGLRVPWLPSAAQVASALAILALTSPAALGGMPFLPVTIEDDRRRRMDQIEQISESTVGMHHDVGEAASALALSQRRLAEVTREVQKSTARVVSETDVVRAAELVAKGEVSPRHSQDFKAALGRVANNSVDLFILLDDAQAQRREEERERSRDAWDEDDWDEDDWDEDDWDEDDFEGWD